MLAVLLALTDCFFDAMGSGSADINDGDISTDVDADAIEVDADSPADVESEEILDADRLDADEATAQDADDEDASEDADLHEEDGDVEIPTGPLYRRQIEITVGSAPIPEGYSIRLDIDHATLVAAGKALTTGWDLRVLRFDGTSWSTRDRVLDFESSWNETSTGVWFATEEPILADETNTEYWLVYGDPDAGPPPANPNDVFRFYDDFESGTLDRWIQVVGTDFDIASERTKSGVRALHATRVNSSDRWIVARDLDEADLVFDAWWNISKVDSMDIAQGIRASKVAPIDQYETNLEGSAGWDIARVLDGYWRELVDQPADQSPQADVWTKVSAVIVGQEMKVYIDGEQTVPSLEAHDVGDDFASGSVGFRIWRIPDGAHWWIDDVRVRSLVDPEPEVTLGPEEDFADHP